MLGAGISDAAWKGLFQIVSLAVYDNYKKMDAKDLLITQHTLANNTMKYSSSA